MPAAFRTNERESLRKLPFHRQIENVVAGHMGGSIEAGCRRLYDGERCDTRGLHAVGPSRVLPKLVGEPATRRVLSPSPCLAYSVPIVGD